MKSLKPKKTYKKFEIEKPIKQILYYGEFNGRRWRKPLWGDYSKIEIDMAQIDEATKAREAFFTKKPTS